MTGMRSSELYALRKDSIFLDRDSIKISESWDWELDQAKETKAKYWRPAPIAKGLKPETERLIRETPGDFLFPRLPEWQRGEQAKVLRSFCDAIGIKSVKFHALRACFATHLLASGVDRATVMRIGGWKTFKSFEVYIRLSGIDEKGATDGLAGKFLKTDQEVVSLTGDIYSKEVA